MLLLLLVCRAVHTHVELHCCSSVRHMSANVTVFFFIPGFFSVSTWRSFFQGLFPVPSVMNSQFLFGHIAVEMLIVASVPGKLL